MQRFLVGRLIIALFTLFAVSIIIFIMARISGDLRTMMLGDFATQEQYERIGQELGLDKSYFEQYWLFLKDLGRGDFGDSVKERKPARDVIGKRILATLELGGAAFVFSVLIGVPLGVLSAVRRASVSDQIGNLVALVGQSAPTFWLGIMLIFFFAVRLDWVPPSGKQDWNSVFLPAVTLGWFFVAANMRLVRSAMLDVLDSEYIKLARAKGVATPQSDLETLPSERSDPAPHVCRSYLGKLSGRFYHHGVGICLARPRAARHSGHLGVGLPGAPGSRYYLHRNVRCHRLPVGHRLRLHRPSDQVCIGTT